LSAPRPAESEQHGGQVRLAVRQAVFIRENRRVGSDEFFPDRLLTREILNGRFWLAAPNQQPAKVDETVRQGPLEARDAGVGVSQLLQDRQGLVKFRPRPDQVARVGQQYAGAIVTSPKTSVIYGFLR
jgi:hypothetical protein